MSGLKHFTYAGRSADGNAVKGNVTAWDRDHALTSLRVRGIQVVDLQTVTQQALESDPRTSIDGESLSILYRQLATLVAAGISLGASFEMLARQDQTAAQKRVLEGVARALSSGLSLSQAMELYPNAFGPPHIAMVRAGEFGGILPRVLEVLAKFTERSTTLQRKVRSATSYPLFVLLASVACVIGLFNFVLPQFFTLVKDLNVKLPWTTSLLIMAARVIGHPLTVAAFIGLLVMSPRIYAHLTRKAEVRMLLDTHSLRAAVIGQVTHKVAMARAMQMLAALASAGINLREALPLAGASCGNACIGKAFEDIVPRLSAGESLSAGMRRNYGMFPRALVAYVEVGELSGQLPSMLVKSAEILSMDAHNALDILPDLIEPLVIVALGLLVGVILVSVFVPLYSALKVV